MSKKIIGYTQGTFDTLHYGHIRLLKNAKENCDILIVGVNSDNLVSNYKKVQTIIPEKERLEIVSSIKYVDKALIVSSLDKLESFKILNYNIVFIGDDWKGSQRWNETEEELKKYGVKVEYLPYTHGISTTIVKSKIMGNKKDD